MCCSGLKWLFYSLDLGRKNWGMRLGYFDFVDPGNEVEKKFALLLARQGQ